MRLIRPDFKITREHGQFVEKGGILFTALYHPSALLRDETKRPDTFTDLKAPAGESPGGLYEDAVNLLLNFTADSDILG